MKEKSCFIAIIDDIDTITIENDNNCCLFSLNGTTMEATIIEQRGNVFIFQLVCPLQYNEYYLLKDCDDYETIVQVRYVVKKDLFDQQYFYDGDDLGSQYHKEFTTFKVWAPTSYRAQVKYIVHQQVFYQEMDKKEKGIYETTIYQDLAHALYCYVLSYNGKEVEVTDIYSFGCNENNKMSAVIDISSLLPCYLSHLKEFHSLNEAIIYELSVRDFSSDHSLGEEVSGKFNAFLKEGLKSKNGNPIGIDYIKSLGITHVQLMPVLDFATVNEENPNEAYNWGYDPVSYNQLEGSYSLHPEDPYTRMNEFKAVVNTFHKAGIRVVLDVVFNHTYAQKDSVFNRLVPHYYYLMNQKGDLSNGSFCGNDLDTTRKMYKKHIIDMCVRLLHLYKIDGLRLDLMGILSIDTVNAIYETCHQINPSFILYGEGWNMPSMLPEDKRASIYNHLSLPHIGFFNDSFRDTMRGKSYDSSMKEQGYLCGNTYKAYHAVRAMRGCVERNCYFTEASKSINYVECHDNATLFDKLIVCNAANTDTERNKIQLCMIAATVFAQGTPFLHMGVEFGRTKLGHENSYNLPDSVNQINWKNVDNYQKNIKALRDFLEIRKTFPFFYLNDKKTIVNSIDGEIIDNTYIKLTYAYQGTVAILIFNPTRKKITLPLNGSYLLYCNVYGKVNDDRNYEEAKLDSYSFAMYIK